MDVTGKKDIKGNFKFDLKASLTEQFKSEDFCDAVLCVGDGKVRAHRCVLAATTPYFRGMFAGSFRERHEQEVDLSHTFNSLNSLRSVVNYIYGEELSVNEENVGDMLRSAEVLMLDDLTQLCIQLLVESLTLQNCLWTWTLAEVYSLKELGDICKDLAVQHFHDVLINCQETLEVPPDFMLKFFQNRIFMHCEPEQLEAFYKRYTESNMEERNSIVLKLRHEVATSKIWADLPYKDAESGTAKDTNSSSSAEEFSLTASNIPVESECTETTEEILIFDTLSKTSLYSTIRNKWFCLIEKKEESNEKLNIRCVGIGSEGNYALAQTRQSYYSSNCTMKLLDISTSEVCTLPEVPRKGYEAIADDVSRSNQTPFCLKGTLYFAYTSTMFTDDESLRDDRPYMSSRHRQETLGVYIQRFDMKKLKWKFIGSVIEISDPRSPNLHLLFNTDNDVFILLFQEGLIKVAKLSAADQRIVHLAAPSVVHFTRQRLNMKHDVYSTKEKIHFCMQNMKMVYDIPTNKWDYTLSAPQDDNSLKDYNIKDISNPIANSHVHGKRYFVTSKVISYSKCLLAVDAITDEVIEVKPPPIDLIIDNVYTTRVPKTLLQKLPSCGPSGNIDKRVCTSQEAREIMKKYKQRKFPEEKQNSGATGIPLGLLLDYMALGDSPFLFHDSYHGYQSDDSDSFHGGYDDYYDYDDYYYDSD